MEDGYEFFAKRQLVTLFSAPNYCGEFDNAGGMMSVDETLMCSFQVNTWSHFGLNDMRLATLLCLLVIAAKFTGFVTRSQIPQCTAKLVRLRL